MKRFIAITAALALLAPAMASGDYTYGPKAGAITSAVTDGPRAVEITGSVTCIHFRGCVPGTVEIVVAPRMAKIIRKPHYDCETRGKYVVCRQTRPGKAVYTRCKSTVPAFPALWNRERVESWEQRLLDFGLTSDAKNPPLEFGWRNPVTYPEEATSQFEARVPLRNGLLTPCIYLVSRSIATVPKRDCLPDLKEEVREELCATETIVGTKLLSRRVLHG